MKKSTLLNKLKTEIQRSLLLKEEDKKFWLKQGDSLPPEVIRQVYDIIRPGNARMRRYILAAIKNDPSLLTMLKEKINQIKKNALKAAEKEQQPDAEETLERELRGI